VSLLRKLLAVFQSMCSYLHLLQPVTRDWNVELKEAITRSQNAKCWQSWQQRLLCIWFHTMFNIPVCEYCDVILSLRLYGMARWSEGGRRTSQWKRV
jgi:hypothetical protein